MQARDEEVQKRGLVYIMCSFNNGQPVVERTPALVELLSCLPIRISAFHFCTTDIARCQQVTDATRVFDTSLLSRFNSHFGNCTEIRHNLMTFGIPLDALPIRDDATIDFQYHNEWVARVEAEENEETQNRQRGQPADQFKGLEYPHYRSGSSWSNALDDSPD